MISRDLRGQIFALFGLLHMLHFIYTAYLESS